MKLFSLSFFSLNTFLEEFFHLDPLLFFHIFLAMKANSLFSLDSSSDSSSEELSTLNALDTLLDDDLDVDSLDVGACLTLWVLRERDFLLLTPSSCWSSYSWTFKVPTSSSRDIVSRFFRALKVVTCRLNFLDKLLKILSMWS